MHFNGLPDRPQPRGNSLGKRCVVKSPYKTGPKTITDVQAKVQPIEKTGIAYSRYCILIVHPALYATVHETARLLSLCFRRDLQFSNTNPAPLRVGFQSSHPRLPVYKVVVLSCCRSL